MDIFVFAHVYSVAEMGLCKRSNDALYFPGRNACLKVDMVQGLEFHLAIFRISSPEAQNTTFFKTSGRTGSSGNGGAAGFLKGAEVDPVED